MASSARDLDRVSKTVHVGGIVGLGEDIKETDLAEFFGQQGAVVAVRISGKFAWVEFADIRAAHMTLALDGETTGGHHLRVSQSKSAIHSNGLLQARRNQTGAPDPAAAAAAAAAYGGVQHMPPPMGAVGAPSPHYGGGPPMPAGPYQMPPIGMMPPPVQGAPYVPVPAPMGMPPPHHQGHHGMPPPQQYPPPYGAVSPHYGMHPMQGGVPPAMGAYSGGMHPPPAMYQAQMGGQQGMPYQQGAPYIPGQAPPTMGPGMGQGPGMGPGMGPGPGQGQGGFRLPPSQPHPPRSG